MQTVTIGHSESPSEVTSAIILGDGCMVDPRAVLGLVPGRKIADLTLNIGAGACVRSGTVIYAGSAIGAGLETGHNVVIREENYIGDGLNIWNNSVIDYGCSIGLNVRIHCNCYVAQFTTIEDDVFLAPGVIIANDPHPICGLCMVGPTIKRGARIGVNVTLLPQITIGEGALIGAGSVVTKDIPPFTVAYGNPARPMKRVEDLTLPARRRRSSLRRWPRRAHAACRGQAESLAEDERGDRSLGRHRTDPRRPDRPLGRVASPAVRGRMCQPTGSASRYPPPSWRHKRVVLPAFLAAVVATFVVARSSHPYLERHGYLACHGLRGGGGLRRVSVRQPLDEHLRAHRHQRPGDRSARGRARHR